MIAELGQFFLTLAFLCALVQFFAPTTGFFLKNPRFWAVGDHAAHLQALFVGGAFACLILVFCQSDFSVLTVVLNSHTDKPLLYKISGSWGNHEGSMLLWCFILAFMGACVSLFGRTTSTRFKARVLAVQGLICLGFLGFLILTSNPFLRLDPAPENGMGLNPLLQDPGLAFHPPLLYLGYVGFSVCFSFAIAALLEERIDPIWASWVKPWTLLAWSSLTFGIGLGSWWAYYELGWGGFWFWDPVENVSLMPWLTGTALLHSIFMIEKRNQFKKWTVLLAILTFSLSMIGTFIVRSGIITSVHAFANDPERGLYILGLVFAYIGTALTLYVLKAPHLTQRTRFQTISKDTSLWINNLFLVTACATVLLGTVYPLLSKSLGWGDLSVGAPFYNTTLLPLSMPFFFLMAIAPFLRWKRDRLQHLLPRLKMILLLSLIFGSLSLFWTIRGPWYSIIFSLLSIWLFLGAIMPLSQKIWKNWHASKRGFHLFHAPLNTYSLACAHGGMAIIILGILGTTVWANSTIQAMTLKDTATLDGYTITFVHEQVKTVENYSARQVKFLIRRGPKLIGSTLAEKRTYFTRQETTTEAGVLTRPSGDIYISLGQKLTDGRWSVHITHHRFIAWLWFGAFLMGLGGLIAIWQQIRHHTRQQRTVPHV